MNVQSDIANPLQLHIKLEILSEQADEADLALVKAIGRDTLGELQHAGYHIQAVPNTARGGDVLVTLVTTLTTLAANAWANKEIFERVLTDAGGLVTVCGGIVPIVEKLQHVFKKRTPATSTMQGSLKITVEIDGASISVEAADLEQAEAALTLAQRFHSTHPAVATRVTADSKVKLKARVPKTQQRKRR